MGVLETEARRKQEIKRGCGYPMLKLTRCVTAIFVLALFASQISYAQTTGADTFKSKCAMCHGEDGLGNTPVGKSMGVVSYKSPEAMKLSTAAMTAIVKNGKNNKMPAFNGQLTDAQIKDVLQYVRTLQKK
jgi:cytochrome c6